MKIAVAGATGRVGRHIVEVLEERGHEPVPISRSNGVDLITAAGLADALAGTDAVIDAATGPSPEQQAATEFFTTAARNIQTAAAAAGARRVVTVSIIGCERFVAGYSAAKCAHEQAALAGPVPAVILRAAQFHEFVEELVNWGRQGKVATTSSTSQGAPAEPARNPRRPHLRRVARDTNAGCTRLLNGPDPRREQLR